MSVWLATVTSQNVPRILLALGSLMVAVVVLWGGLWYYRRHWIQAPGSSASPWTLEDIRAMRDRGDVTEEEYQVLRANLLGLMSSGVSGSAPAKPGSAGVSKSRPDRAKESDPSGETVWSFDLKKSPPG